MLTRVLISLLLLFSMLFLPWGISFIIGLGAIIYFRNYYEAVLLFLLSDLFYGVREERFLYFYFVSTVVAFIIVVLAEIIKTKLKFYNYVK